MKPKVSIIVPVYNVEKYLARCLDSLVNQTLDDIEIIVVNDGTKDNSQLIIDQYVKNYPNKVYSFIKENGGLGDARNFGMKHAKADYIGFVDSDDYVEQAMFEKMYTKAIKTDSDLVICDIEYVWEESKKRKYLPGLRILDGIDSRKTLFLSPLFAWNKLYRRDLILSNGLAFPQRLWYEDIPVTIPIFSIAKRVSYVNDILIYYVQRSNSIMGTKNSSKLRDIFEILKLVYDFYIEKNLLQSYHDEIEYLFIEQLILYGSFRFYRSKTSTSLMKDALRIMQEYFPKWRKNPYITTLHPHYQIYLKTISRFTMPFFKAFVLIKGTKA